MEDIILSNYKDFSATKYNETSRNVVVPGGVKEIGMGYFENLNIETVILPEGLERISVKAFKGCRNLTSINFPKSLKEISWSAFEDCEKLNISNFESCLTRIGEYAFKNCKSLNKMVIDVDADVDWCAFQNSFIDELVIKKLNHKLEFIDESLNKFHSGFSFCKGKQLIIDKSMDKFIGALYEHIEDGYIHYVTPVFEFDELFLPRTIKEVDSKDVLHQFDKIVFYGEGKLNDNVLDSLIQRTGREYIKFDDGVYEHRCKSKTSHSSSDIIKPVSIINLTKEEQIFIQEESEKIRLKDYRYKNGLCINCGNRLTRKSLINSFKVCKKCGYDPKHTKHILCDF